ncbi:hypothetical protein NKG05_20520 [Oerskovia sp. M15]
MRLEHVLPLVDWVGLDIKHLPDAYERITGAALGRGRVPLAGSAAALGCRARGAHDRGPDRPLAGGRPRALRAALGARRPGPRAPGGPGPRYRPGYAAALGGRHLSDVLHDDDVPRLRRRT